MSASRGAADPHPWRRARTHLGVLIGAFALVQVIWALVGVRFDDSPIDGTPGTDTWQLLDVHLLHHHLVQSVWYLQSQPPLFNVWAGVLLHLPHGLRRVVEAGDALACGLVLVLCAYQLCVGLRVPRTAALVVVLVGIVASPAYLLYANWLDYSEPTATCLILGTWLLLRYLATRRTWRGLAAMAAYSAVVLTSTHFQVEWVIGVVVLAVVLCRPVAKLPMRQLAAILLLPLVLVGGWYAKNAVLFHTTSTSSWLGMNLARPLFLATPHAQLVELEHEGVIGKIALITPFGAPEVYVPAFVQATPSPVPAIGALRKADGSPNYNNPLYIEVANQYLRSDLSFIGHRPGTYAHDVSRAVQVWLVPTDQNFTNSVNWPHVRSYAALYDHLVEWQPTRDPAAALVALESTPSPLAWISLQAVFVTVLTLLGGPAVAWRWRRHRTAEAAVVAVMAWTTAFVFAISSLVEIGENERFRSELGPLPLITATVVLAALWRRWRQPTDVGEGRSESEAPDDALSGASSPNSMASGEGTSGDGPSVANVS